MIDRAPANAPQSATHVDLRIITRAGIRRARLLAGAELELEAIVDELERVKAAGGKVNVKRAAELGGVTRDTIYARLRSRAAAPENTDKRGPA